MESDSLQSLTKCSNTPVQCTPSINFHIQHLLNSNDDIPSENNLKIGKATISKSSMTNCDYNSRNRSQIHSMNMINDSHDLYYTINQAKKKTTSYNENAAITNPTDYHNNNNNNNNNLLGTMSQLMHNYSPEKISLFLKFMQNFYSDMSDIPSEQFHCLLKTKLATTQMQDQQEKEVVNNISKRTTTTTCVHVDADDDDDTISDQNHANLPSQMKTNEQQEQQLQNMKILKHLMKDYIEMKGHQQNEVSATGFFTGTNDVKYAQKAFELLTNECGTSNLLPFMLHNPASGYPSIPIYNRNTYPSKQCRRRKARTVFSDHQLTGLEHRFETQHYLSTPERIELANRLNLSETQVKTWFQNRRMKHKKLKRCLPDTQLFPQQNTSSSSKCPSSTNGDENDDDEDDVEDEENGEQDEDDRCSSVGENLTSRAITIPLSCPTVDDNRDTNSLRKIQENIDSDNNNSNNVDGKTVESLQVKTTTTVPEAVSIHSTRSTQLDNSLKKASLISSPSMPSTTSPFSPSFPTYNNFYTSSNNESTRSWTNLSSQLRMDDFIKNFLTYDMIYDKGYLKSTLDYIHSSNNNNNNNNTSLHQNDSHYTPHNLCINNNSNNNNNNNTALIDEHSSLNK